jgi:hypothetical protein
MRVSSVVGCAAVLLAKATEGFVSQQHAVTTARVVAFSHPSKRGRVTISSLKMATKYDMEGVGFEIMAQKPLGVVFGENPSPFRGLVADDVEPGLNGGKAGIRMGDQLMAVNGQSVVGGDFDSVMDTLIDAEGTIRIQMYRGKVQMLYGELLEKNKASGDLEMEDEEEESDEEIIIMDENYESPVKVEITEDKPLTAGDVFKALKKVGSMLTEDVTSEGESSAPEKKEPQKKKGGLFGGLFSGETIQLDGEDATGLSGRGAPRKFDIGKRADEIKD